MVANPRQPWLSVEEYFELEKQRPDMRYEYIDGEVRAFAGGTIDHGRIALNIAKWLDDRLQHPCHVHTSDIKVRLNASRYTYPDVHVSCEESDWQGRLEALRAPKLIVEVLSPGTEAYDRGRKFLYYQELASIREYVLVNWQRQLVEVYRRENGKWIYQRYAPGEQIELASLALELPMSVIYASTTVPLKEVPQGWETFPDL
ncbi:MAG: Uma2 family endonuclease [Ktedonobacteraceae bacterium]|nr:Uma2 family endonuclease [Ktedonobacteraceae bacterium]